MIETARRLVSQKEMVRVVSLNNKSTDYVRTQLIDSKAYDVVTWHGLRGQARTSETGKEGK